MLILWQDLPYLRLPVSTAPLQQRVPKVRHGWGGRLAEGAADKAARGCAYLQRVVACGRRPFRVSFCVGAGEAEAGSTMVRPSYFGL